MRRPGADALVFQSLWTTGEPVPLDHLTRAEVAGPMWVRQQGENVATDKDGNIIGFRGLSVQPTDHRLELPERTLWTWCAFDAVGIMAAFEASGRIVSADPLSGTPIKIDFQRGQPTTNDLVVFFADAPSGGVDRTDWCPLVNFFENAEAANQWATERGRSGEPVSLIDATRQGAAFWRPLAEADPGL
ncbi:MAG: organomercurial lyase [Actinomycetota bacterium]